MTNPTGALPYQHIADFMRAGFIQNAVRENVSPASLDLALSDEAYIVERVLRPGPSQAVGDLLAQMGARRHALTEPLHKGKLYLIKLEESLELPPDIQGYCNPKSSTGRLDVHVRVMVDGVYEYDTVPREYRGPLWLFFTAKSFGIQAHPGDTLTQLRLIRGKSRLSQTEMEAAFVTDKLAWSMDTKRKLKLSELQQVENEGGLMLSLYMPKRGEVYGYRCTATEGRVLDLHDRDVNPRLFFQPEYVLSDSFVELTANRFYVLSSAERIRIPPCFAAEMVAVHERIGEHRSHYAGFLDPGWGWGEGGEARGRPFTLEVRSPEKMVIVHGQPVARIVYERMLALPEVQYDAPEKVSHYTAQCLPALAKQFALWPG